MVNDNTIQLNAADLMSEEELISRYVSDDVLSFSEVSRFSGGGLSETLTKAVFGKDSIGQGIKVEIEEGILTITIHINVFYGSNIPQLSYDIQSKIKKTIEEKTDLQIKAVNISVEGIDRIKE